MLNQEKLLSPHKLYPYPSHSHTHQKQITAPLALQHAPLYRICTIQYGADALCVGGPEHPSRQYLDFSPLRLTGPLPVTDEHVTWAFRQSDLQHTRALTHLDLRHHQHRSYPPAPVQSVAWSSDSSSRAEIKGRTQNPHV